VTAASDRPAAAANLRWHAMIWATMCELSPDELLSTTRSVRSG
jgi:hypothetical protein